MRRALVPLAALGATTLTCVWTGLGLAPPTIALRYGIDGGGGVGRRVTVAGIEFVRVLPGAFVDDLPPAPGPTGPVAFPERIRTPLFLASRPTSRRRWRVVPDWFWVAAREIGPEQVARLGLRFPYVSGEEGKGYTWAQARRICERIQAELQGEVRLPTPTEWEYLASAGRGLGAWERMMRSFDPVRPPHPGGLEGIDRWGLEWCRSRGPSGSAPALRGVFGWASDSRESWLLFRPGALAKEQIERVHADVRPVITSWKPGAGEGGADDE